MSKIIINSEIKSSDGKDTIKEKNAILKDGNIYFNHDKVNNTITIKDNMVIIKRENDEYNIVLEFEEKNKKNGKYYIKEIDMDMMLNVETHKMIINDNSIVIEYTIYINDVKSDDFIYKMEWRDL